MSQGGSNDPSRLRRPGIAYLLSVVGTASTQAWQERMRKMGRDPREMVVLRMVAAEPGRSQRSLAPALQVRASHLVAVIDGLEGQGLLERRPNPADRRAHALHLTSRGTRELSKLMEVSAEHERELVAGLSSTEQKSLEILLAAMARELGLAEGGHPGFDEPDDNSRAAPP